MSDTYVAWKLVGVWVPHATCELCKLKAVVIPSQDADNVDEQAMSPASSGPDELQALVKRLHKEVMQKLDDQDVLLRRVTPTPAPAPPLLFDPRSSPSLTSSVMQDMTNAGSSSSAQEGTSGSHERATSRDAEYKTLCTYTSFDGQLREGADSVAASVSRKQFAETTGKQHVHSEEARRPCTVKGMVENPFFDIFFGMVVLTNAVFIGIDLQERLSNQGEQPLSLRIVQYFYALLFAIELILRMVAHGKRFLFSEDWMWGLLDIFIVLTSLWEVFAGILHDIGQSEVGSIGGVSSLKAFRMIRLTRILKPGS